MSSSSEDDSPVISHLPPELVELIMSHLDGRTFANCRRVCKGWRQIADRLASEVNIWKRFCVSEFPDVWVYIFNKGDMPWSDVYANIFLWARIKSARVSKVLFQNFSNTVDKHIVALNITKGGCANVTLSNSIRVYDIKTKKTVEEISGQYFCYFENEYVKLIHSHNHTLILKPASIHDHNFHRDALTVDNVYLFKVSSNVCYYVTLKQELWMLSLNADSYGAKSFLIKWYNSDTISAIDCHNDKVFLLTHSGKILTYELNRLVKVRDVRWPYTFNLYQKFYLYRGNIFFYCDYTNFHISIPNGKEVNYTDLFASSILFHGNILVIGTYFGLLTLYLIDDVEDLLTLDQISPIASHLLCVEFPISGIDIFEESGCHCVFAWTQTNIFMIKYSHFNKNCSERVLCNSFEYCSLRRCPDTSSCDLSFNGDDAT